MRALALAALLLTGCAGITPAPDYGFGLSPGDPFHTGVDWMASRGRPVYAATDGDAMVDCRGGKGFDRYIAVFGAVTMTRYHHLDECLVEDGGRVRRGQVIGTVGNTGTKRDRRPHLHFEVWQGMRPVDPLPWIADGRIHHPMRRL